MKIIRGRHNLQRYNNPSIVTIGAFDGLHRGHQAVLKQLQQSSLSKVVVMFEPLPKEYFSQQDLPRLSRLRDKTAFLKVMGVDVVLLLRFDANMAAMSAQDFINEVLIQGLQTQHLIVGDDFRFGAQRQGDFKLLQSQAGFTCSATQTLLMDNRRVSSSWLREAVLKSDFSEAEKVLGRPYCLSGRIQHGDKNGRKLGFPTLNIALPQVMAVSGVYVVQVKGLNDQVYNGVANVGIRPTMKLGMRRLLEVHLFGFEGDAYGVLVEVQFLSKIRDEQKFASFEELQAQIKKDVAEGMLRSASR